MNDLFTSIVWILIVLGLLVVPGLLGLCALEILSRIIAEIEAV